MRRKKIRQQLAVCVLSAALVLPSAAGPVLADGEEGQAPVIELEVPSQNDQGEPQYEVTAPAAGDEAADVSRVSAYVDTDELTYESQNDPEVPETGSASAEVNNVNYEHTQENPDPNYGYPVSAVLADGEGAEVTVNGNVNASVEEDSSYSLPYNCGNPYDQYSDQMGYSAVQTDNGGKADVAGDVNLSVDFERDYGEGENVHISGVDAGSGGEISVGGSVTVNTGTDPNNFVVPDADADPFDPYEALLGHYSTGVNNEGGTVKVGDGVSVNESQYAIGIDAGEKYLKEEGYWGEDDSDYMEYVYGLVEMYQERVNQTGKNGSWDELVSAVAEGLDLFKDLDAISKTEVSGDVNARGGMYAKGVYARSNADVTVDGNVSGSALLEPGSRQMTEEMEQRIRESETFSYLYEAKYNELENSPEYENMSDAEKDAAYEAVEKDALNEVLNRWRGVNIQGVVAQGHSGVLSDETREDLWSFLSGIFGEKETIDMLETYPGLDNMLPMVPDSDDEAMVNTVLMAAMAKGDRTSVEVTGDVTARDGKITKGVFALDSDVKVGGSVSSEGLAAAGVVAVGDDAQVKVDNGISSEGRDSAVGVASFGGSTDVKGDVVVKSEDSGTGVWLRGGNVTVAGDVSVDAGNGSGIRTINLDNRMITVMGLMDEDWYGYDVEGLINMEAVFNCINRYSGSMNAGDILAYFINDSSDRSVVIDGTVTADNGISVIDNKASADLAMDYIANMALLDRISFWSSSGLEQDLEDFKAIDPRGMTDDELDAAYKDAVENRDYELQRLYGISKALRAIGKEDNADQDITVWEIDAAKELVRSDKEELSWKDFFNEWTFSMPGYEGRMAAAEGYRDAWDAIFNSKVLVDHGTTAKNVQANLNYIIRIGSVTGGDGTISLGGTRDSHGFATAHEGEEVTVYVACADGYEVVSVSGRTAELVRNKDGSWTLIVPAGGGVLIDAVLRAIEKAEEEGDDDIVVPVQPTPDPDTPEEQDEKKDDVKEEEKEEKEEKEAAAPVVPAAAPAAERADAADVVIVGADVTGLMAAYEMKKKDPELSVLLLDSHDSLRDFAAAAEEEGRDMEDVILYELLGQIEKDFAQSIRTSTKTEELLVENGKVTGVLASDAQGSYAIRSKEVLLTDDSSRDLIEGCLDVLSDGDSGNGTAVRVDVNCQVLGYDGQPVESLYAVSGTVDTSALPEDLQYASSDEYMQAKTGTYAGDVIAAVLRQ